MSRRAGFFSDAWQRQIFQDTGVLAAIGESDVIEAVPYIGANLSEGNTRLAALPDGLRSGRSAQRDG